MVKLGEVFKVIRNGASIKQFDGAGGLPITRIETIADRIVDRNRFGYANITEVGKYEDYLLKDGDILMSHINSEKHLGKVALYKAMEDEQIIHGMNLLLLRADNKRLLPGFAKYYFESSVFARNIVNITKKSVNQASFTVTALKELEFICPCLGEQDKIVNELTKISKVIDQRKQQLQKLDELVKARFVEMFGDEFNSFLKLGDLASVTGGLTKNAKRKDMLLKLPYLRVANVYFNHIDTREMLEIGLTEEEHKKTLLKHGDLLFVEGNGSPEQIGRVAMWRDEVNNCVHQNHLIKVRLDVNNMNPVFVMHYFMTLQGREQIKKKAVSTSGLHTLSVSKISDLEVPIVPIYLQNLFVDFVEQIDKSKLEVQKSLDKLETLKKALIQKYFG